MGLFDNFFTSQNLPGVRAENRSKEIDAETKALILQRLKAQIDAQSRLYGGQDSNQNGIMWSPQQAGGGMAQVNGQRVPMTAEGLMGAGIPAAQAGNLMNGGPDDAAAMRERLLRQADPGAFMKSEIDSAVMLPRLKAAGLTEDQIRKFMIDPKTGGEQVVKSAFPEAPKIPDGMKADGTVMPGYLDYLAKKKAAETDPMQKALIQSQIDMHNASAEASRAKAVGQSYFSGLPEGVVGTDAYDWVSQNMQGGEQIAAIARKVAAGDMKMPTAGRPGSIGEKVMGLVALAEPGVDVGQRFRTAQEYGQAGPTGKAIRAVDTVMFHTDKMLKNFAALDNSDYPAWNSVANTAKQAVGKGEPTATTTSRDAVASEARKVFAGASGGGLTELEEWKANLPQNASPEQMTASAQTLVDLLKGRIDPLLFNYNQTMGTNKTIEDFLTPASVKVWKELEAAAQGGKVEAAPNPGITPVQTITGDAAGQKAWEGLKPGTPYIDPNGVTRTKK